MKKLKIATTRMLVLAMFFFIAQKTEALSERLYGGSGNVTVTVYKKVFTTTGTKQGEKVRSYQLDAAEPCSHRDIPAAKTALQRELEYQKDMKNKLDEMSEFTSGIYYDIDSCEK